MSDNAKQHAIEYIERQIAELLKRKAELELLPDNLPGRLYADQFDINLVIPWNIETVRQCRQKLGDGWKRTQGHRGDDGSVCLTYRHETGARLWVKIDAQEAGPTCERVQIGEKTVPVYKVVCR